MRPDTESKPRRPALTITEAAEALTISKAGVYRLAKAGKLRIVKIGSRSIVPAEEVDRLIVEGTE